MPKLKLISSEWKKDTLADGYQIQIATDSAFKNKVKTVKVS